jgi:hypothetical protein
LTKCEPWSSVPENNGKACGMWLAVCRRASWYVNTEYWNHSALCWWNRLGTRSCDWCLTSLVRRWLLYYHIACSWYVRVQVFMGFRSHQSGWSSQILPQVFEGHLCLLSPLKLVLFLEELIEREPPNAKSWDESTQGNHTPHQLLDIMESLGRLHFCDSRHLL